MNNRLENEPKENPNKNDPYGHDPKRPVIKADDDAPEYENCADVRAVSATDCTGLIPALPVSDSELESYAQVYHYPADIFKG